MSFEPHFDSICSHTPIVNHRKLNMYYCAKLRLQGRHPSFHFCLFTYSNWKLSGCIQFRLYWLPLRIRCALVWYNIHCHVKRNLWPKWHPHAYHHALALSNHWICTNLFLMLSSSFPVHASFVRCHMQTETKLKQIIIVSSFCQFRCIWIMNLWLLRISGIFGRLTS